MQRMLSSLLSPLYFLLSTALLPSAVDCEVLEPSSTVLQTVAIPSQLPVRQQAVGCSDLGCR